MLLSIKTIHSHSMKVYALIVPLNMNAGYFNGRVDEYT